MSERHAEGPGGQDDRESFQGKENPDATGASGGTESFGGSESSGESTAATGQVVRVETFPADGPVELDLGLSAGRVELRLDSTAGDGAVRVELRHEPAAGTPWSDGVSNVLSWVSERFGSQFGEQLGDQFGQLRGLGGGAFGGAGFGGAFGEGGFPGTPAEAVRQSRIEKTGNRVVVRAPKPLPLRNIPLAVTVHAPAGSHLEIRAGGADVRVTGTAGRAEVTTGTGDVAVERADGSARVRTGSGSISLGPTLAGLEVKTGSGDVEASSVAGSGTLVTGTGNLWLGVVSGQVFGRSGSGNLSVAEAASGSLELMTGSGEIRIGVRAGVDAEVTLSSSSGRVFSELDVAGTPPGNAVPLTVRARTGTGNAVLAPATQ